MKLIIQRVHTAAISVNDKQIAKINRGLLAFLGVGLKDSEQDADFLIEKILNLRVFENETGKMHYSLLDKKLELLLVPQFTIMGDCRKGRRPDFSQAAPPDVGESLFNYFVTNIRRRWKHVQTGQFKTHMDVALINDGPVTLILDSNEKNSLL